MRVSEAAAGAGFGNAGAAAALGNPADRREAMASASARVMSPISAITTLAAL
jgi:hypothetical protein